MKTWETADPMLLAAIVPGRTTTLGYLVSVSVVFGLASEPFSVLSLLAGPLLEPRM